jgi:excisionase family DNA binding protein
MAKLTNEKLLTIEEVATYLRTSKETVRRMFRDQPGVLRLGNQGRRNKRDHVSLRIPESVLNRELESRLN